MSLPQNIISDIKKSSVTKIEENLKSNKLVINQKKILLDAAQEKMFSVEEKWIKNEISKDTYDRWYTTYNTEVTSCKDSITRLSHVDKHAFTILQKNLDLLVDLKSIYNRATITQKREFVKLVFDSNLYYQDGIYRTPTMIDLLSRNHLLMKEKGLLLYNKKRDDFSIIPSSGVAGNRTRVQTSN